MHKNYYYQQTVFTTVYSGFLRNNIVIATAYSGSLSTTIITINISTFYSGSLRSIVYIATAYSGPATNNILITTIILSLLIFPKLFMSFLALQLSTVTTFELRSLLLILTTALPLLTVVTTLLTLTSTFELPLSK